MLARPECLDSWHQADMLTSGPPVFLDSVHCTKLLSSNQLCLELLIFAGREYEQRLRQLYARMNPRTTWAKLDKAARQRSQDDGNSDTEGCALPADSYRMYHGSCTQYLFMTHHHLHAFQKAGYLFMYAHAAPPCAKCLPCTGLLAAVQDLLQAMHPPAAPSGAAWSQPHAHACKSNHTSQLHMTTLYTREEAAGRLTAGAEPLLGRDRSLSAKVLEVSRVNDANEAEPSSAVVRSVEFHPSGQLLLTAGLDKRLRFFQVTVLCVHFWQYCICLQVSNPVRAWMALVFRHRGHAEYEVQEAATGR